MTEPEPLVCPTKGDRWAIDADVTEGPDGAVWMTWRDGQRADADESALSAMRLKFGTDGSVDRASKPTVIMRSDDLAWAHYRKGKKGVTVIENPSAFFNAGSWYLFYSGNKWQQNYYATGIAHCGAKLDDGLCRQMPDNQVAWFAYVAPERSAAALEAQVPAAGQQARPRRDGCLSGTRRPAVGDLELPVRRGRAQEPHRSAPSSRAPARLPTSRSARHSASDPARRFDVAKTSTLP